MYAGTHLGVFAVIQMREIFFVLSPLYSPLSAPSVVIQHFQFRFQLNLPLPVFQSLTGTGR